MVEYTGLLQMAQELYRGVTHYFDCLSLTVQPMVVVWDLVAAARDKNNSSSTHSGRCNRRTSTAGMLWMPFCDGTRCLFFRSTTSGGSLNKPILSRWRQPAERAYTHWLWDDGTDEEGAVHWVMVQCCCQ